MKDKLGKFNTDIRKYCFLYEIVVNAETACQLFELRAQYFKTFNIDQNRIFKSLSYPRSNESCWFCSDFSKHFERVTVTILSLSVFVLFISVF